ncbi:Aspartate aminotransferase [uncultured archaeon]|nr:Aspartate aminotransferase [uncultured archaeon]
MFYELAEKINAMGKSGKKVVKLNIGDTNLPTPQEALAAAKNAMANATAGYGTAAGLPELRRLAAEREGCGIENIVIGPGSKHLIYGLLSVLAAKGGKVAVPAPNWPMYAMACRQLGLGFLPAKTGMEGNWQFDAIPNSGVTIICNPNNPTSTIYTADSVGKAIAGAAGHVILDEAYKGLAFGSIPAFDCIRVRSFSKEFNMENWRLGYAVAPANVAKKLISYNQITCTCVPEFVQAAGVACLENEKGILVANRKIWKARMDAAVSAMRKAGFLFAPQKSAMYVFATHREITDGGKFAAKLLEKGVAVAPGNDFGEKKYFRVACNREPEVLKAAVEKMAEAL